MTDRPALAILAPLGSGGMGVVYRDRDVAVKLVAGLLEGETLRERLRSGPLPLPKVVEYAHRAAQGLAAARAAEFQADQFALGVIAAIIHEEPDRTDAERSSAASLVGGALPGQGAAPRTAARLPSPRTGTAEPGIRVAGPHLCHIG